MDKVTQGNFEVVDDNRQDEYAPMPSDDQIQAYVHNKRVQLVKEMMNDDGTMPQDAKDRLVMLSALKDIDGSAQARKRLRVEEEAASDGGVVNTILAKVLNAMPNISKRDIEPVASRQAPKLGAEFASPEILEGETATTLPQQSYDTFMSKFPRPGETK